MRAPSNDPTTDRQGLRLEMAKLWRQMRPGRDRDFVSNQFVADGRGGWLLYQEACEHLADDPMPLPYDVRDAFFYCSFMVPETFGDAARAFEGWKAPE
jgi:hypothetical protein